MSTISPNKLVDQLNWRYAVKAFDPEREIAAETWNALEQSLVLAPSSFGIQPWKFIVLTDRDLRESLVEYAWKQRQVVDCSHFVVFAAPTDLGADDVDRFADRAAEVRNAPPESMDGFRTMVKGFLGNFDDPAKLNWSIRQIYLALGQLMTSAAVLGIDTCPMEGFSPPDFDRILGLTEQNLTAAVCCAVGYRGEDDKYASLPKVRYPREDVLEVR